MDFLSVKMKKSIVEFWVLDQKFSWNILSVSCISGISLQMLRSSLDHKGEELAGTLESGLLAHIDDLAINRMRSLRKAITWEALKTY